MNLATFWGKNKLGITQFFQEIFLLADINIKIVLDIIFFSFLQCKHLICRKKLN